MPNRAVELHDSHVTGFRIEGATCVLDLKAYVHQSDGTPGDDPGTGWTQPMRLTLENQVVHASPTALPLWILDGWVSVGDRVFDNMLPLPFCIAGPVRLRFCGAEGTLEVAGEGLLLTETGDAVFLEQVPGSGEPG